MGYEVFALLVAVLVLPLVALGFVAFWSLTHRERSALEREWRAYAIARDREYVPARGEWPNRSSPRVRWRRGAFPFELAVRGKEAEARTRVVTWPRGRLLGDFRVATRPSHEGDVFERVFAVEERPAGLAARVLDDGARRALLGFRQRDTILLRYTKGSLVLEWPGRELNDARIDEAERLLADLARNVDAAFAGVNAPRGRGTGAERA